MKIFLLILIPFFALTTIGCKSEITNEDDWANHREKYINKKFVINSEFFVVKFHDEIIKEKWIKIPGDISGFKSVPTRKEFLDNPSGTYLYGEDKIINLTKKNKTFKICHVMYYRKNSSDNFVYLVVESLEGKEKFAILRPGFGIGIREGYIEIIN